MVIKYIVFAVLSLLFSLCIEKISDAVIKGEKLSLKSKLNVKRLVLISVVNLAVWLGCILFNPGFTVGNAVSCLGFDILLCIAICDFKTEKIPDFLLIALAVSAVIFTLVDTKCEWYMHLLGGAIGFVILFFLYFVGNKILKQKALGIGDVYLSGILGLFVGTVKFFLCGLVASIIGLIAIEIIKFKKKYDKTYSYPFSPFFAIGFAAVILLANMGIEYFQSMLYGIFLLA